MPKKLPATDGMPDEAARLLQWYDRHRRVLPWRAAPGERADPYAVWLSEIMLQQTGVATVGSYFRKFLQQWPRVDDLAAAPVEAVMQAWAGLGYYSRARNLHACAKAIVADFGGKVPENESDLLSLPGVGPYTAAAISAIAFDRRAVVVDGNVERVAARLMALETPMPAGKAAIKTFVGAMTPDSRPGDFAQAMMDLGATICTPRNPACALCPFSAGCVARKAGSMLDYPRKTAKKPRPLRRGEIFYLRRADGAVLARTRPPRGLLGGMTEFPGTDWRLEGHLEPHAALALAPVPGAYRLAQAKVEHVFTHFELHLHVYAGVFAQKTPAPQGCRWIAAADLPGAALPTLMRKAQKHACALLDQQERRHKEPSP